MTPETTVTITTEEHDRLTSLEIKNGELIDEVRTLNAEKSAERKRHADLLRRASSQVASCKELAQVQSLAEVLQGLANECEGNTITA